MGKTIRVEVTADDIANGERDNCCSCPIALALKRAFNSHSSKAMPGRLFIAGTGEQPAAACRTPEEALRFMDDFDNGRPVQPFAFDVELP